MTNPNFSFDKEYWYIFIVLAMARTEANYLGKQIGTFLSWQYICVLIYILYVIFDDEINCTIRKSIISYLSYTIHCPSWANFLVCEKWKISHHLHLHVQTFYTYIIDVYIIFFTLTRDQWTYLSNTLTWPSCVNVLGGI